MKPWLLRMREVRWAGTAMVLACMACLDPRVAEPEKEGNSSETVAMVGGRVVDQKGLTVAGAWVALVPDGFNPLSGHSVPANLTARTNINGEYFIPKVPKGRYGVEAAHPMDGTRAFASGLELNAEITIPADTLRATGHLRLKLPDYLKEAKGSVFIPHTRYSWPLTATMLEHGFVELDSIPAGLYGALAYSPDTSIDKPDTVARDVEVHAADTTTLGAFAGWLHSGMISVNTKASGAGVAQTLTDFPMLLRLDATNFDFSQSSSDGRDLRFAKADGKSLAFQIEHWDAQKSRAEVWIALDSVRGNDSAQYCRMFWGKPGAVSRSDGPTVFGGTAGYAGVWHLDEEASGTGTVGLYRNAATAFDNGLDSLTLNDQVGAIGNGHLFLNGEYIRIPAATGALKPLPAVTLSAWVRATATDSSGGEIASMGNDYGIRLTPQGNAYVFCFNIPRTDSSNFLLVTSGLNLLDNAWHHIVGILNGARAEIYVDGVYRAGQDFRTGAFKYDGGPDFFIGHHGNGETPYDFNGNIDEVRVFPGASSAAWLKLSYESQKPGAAVVMLSR